MVDMVGEFKIVHLGERDQFTNMDAYTEEITKQLGAANKQNASNKSVIDKLCHNASVLVESSAFPPRQVCIASVPKLLGVSHAWCRPTALHWRMYTYQKSAAGCSSSFCAPYQHVFNVRFFNAAPGVLRLLWCLGLLGERKPTSPPFGMCLEKTYLSSVAPVLTTQWRTCAQVYCSVAFTTLT